MNDATRTQLRLIAQIRDALLAERIEWWLYGGWAVDFAAGEITRDHSDIEIFFWLRDLDALQAALVRAGFDAPPGLYPRECQPFVKDGQEIGAWFLIYDDNGAIVTPGRWDDWPWPDGAFDDVPGGIGDLEVPIMSAAAQLEMKRDFHKHRYGAPPREKDIADMERLRAVIASQTDDGW